MRISLKHSRRQWQCVALLAIISCSLILLLNLFWYFKLSGIVIIASGMILILRKNFGFSQSDFMISLSKITKDDWMIEYSSGSNFIGSLQGCSIVNKMFCIIILKSSHSILKKNILIFKDSMSESDYHSLRLNMKGLLSD